MTEAWRASLSQEPSIMYGLLRVSGNPETLRNGFFSRQAGLYTLGHLSCSSPSQCAEFGGLGTKC